MSTKTMETPNQKFMLWCLRIIPAIILLQTLFFKFSASQESVYIFSTLGVEPYGRIGAGISELIAAVLLLMPRTTLLGALLGAGIMAGALLSHIASLGIEVMGDGGYLFALAIITLLCCSVLVYLLRSSLSTLPIVGKMFFKSYHKDN
ncbi:MAG: DoxX family protein [Flavobacteriales bacterium]